MSCPSLATLDTADDDDNTGKSVRLDMECDTLMASISRVEVKLDESQLKAEAPSSLESFLSLLT